MRIIGVDLHTRQQSVAMLDTDTREVVNAAIKHEGNIVREFYGNPPTASAMRDRLCRDLQGRGYAPT